MIRRMKNSWLLLERSLVVLRQNLKLLLFPIITMCCTLGIVLFFLGAFLFQPTGHSYTEKAHWKAVSESLFTAESLARVNKDGATKADKEQVQYTKKGMGTMIVLYFFFMFMATFFNVAFYHEIIDALNGQPVGIIKGFAFAASRVQAIFLWSFMAGLVGYLIKQIEQRVGFLGKILVNLIGLAWSVAAVFSIPVLICEKDVTNPFTVLKSSAMTLKKTWGETLIGFTGLTVGTFIVIFLSFFAMFAGLFLSSALSSSALGATVFLGWMFFVFTFAYLSSVASNIYQCALYLFASTGQVPSGFNREMMDLAWVHKKA
jgi:hypothetical protein